MVKKMRKNRLILKKENKFKKILINITLVTSLISGSYFGLGAIKGIMELHNQNVSSTNQTQIVTDSLNPDYNQPSSSKTEDNNETIPEKQESKYDFNSLWKTNPNIVGIIEGDCFEGGYYPVVSTNSFDEENYYLDHSVDGSESSTGTIFSDYQNDNTMQSDVTAIWGHNMHGQNGIMFSDLTNYKNQDYFENHQTLKYYTPNGEYNLEIFAYIEDDPHKQTIGNYNSNEEMVNAMNNIKSESMISSNINIELDDRIMILYTCTDLGSLYDPNNRSSVYAVLKPVWEKTNLKSKTI